MPKLSGKNGKVFNAISLIGDYSIEPDCITTRGIIGVDPTSPFESDELWRDQNVVGVSLAKIHGERDIAMRATLASIGANTVLMSHAINKDLSRCYALIVSLRSSVTTQLGDLQVLLDNTANCASPLESLDIPALTAGVWTVAILRLATPASLSDIHSIGIKQVADLADTTIDIEDVVAMQITGGMTAWNIDVTTGTEEVTDFESGGHDEHITTILGWKGGFEGYKTGAPVDKGKAVYVWLSETAESGQEWVARCIVSNVSATVEKKAAVKYKYTFNGSGYLQKATA